MKRGHVWWSYFYLDGVRHQSSTGTSNRRQAEAIEQKFRDEANARQHQLVQYDPDLTFAALATRFLADGQVRPHYVWHLKSLLPFFGDALVLRLNRNMAREIICAESSSRRWIPGCAAARFSSSAGRTWI